MWNFQNGRNNEKIKSKYAGNIELGSDDWGFVGALLLGLAGLAILAGRTADCPVCYKKIAKNAKFCPHCKTPLSW